MLHFFNDEGFLNNNWELNNPPLQFTDENGVHKSLCCEQKGLGVEGLLINIEGNY